MRDADGVLTGLGPFTLTADGPLYTIPCEAVFNRHPDIYRSALVGVGPHTDQLVPAAGDRGLDAGRSRPVAVSLVFVVLVMLVVLVDEIWVKPRNTESLVSAGEAEPLIAAPDHARERE